MGDKVTDYYHVEIPHDTSPENFSTYERRAEILEFVLSARSPKSVNRTQLADRYQVAVSTVSRDIDRLGDAIAELFDERSMTLETRALREQIVTDLLEEDSWRASKAAFDVHMDFLDYLGFDDVLAADDADGDDEDEGPRTGRRGEPGEHRLSKRTREQIAQFHEKDERELEEKGLVVEQGDHDCGQNQNQNQNAGGG